MAIPMSHLEDKHKTHPAFLLLRSLLFPELLHCHLLGIMWSEPRGHKVEFECCLDLFAGLSLESLAYGRTSFNHLVSMFSIPSISTAHDRKSVLDTALCKASPRIFTVWISPALPISTSTSLPLEIHKGAPYSFPEIHWSGLLCTQCPLPFPAPSAPVP